MPFAIVSFEEAGAPFSSIGLGAWAGSAKPAWKPLTYWTSPFTSPSVRFGHGGIEVYGMPVRITRSRSPSVGRAPLGVVRSLNLPRVKSRGGGRRCAAAQPFPSPLSPWHCAQFLS